MHILEYTSVALITITIFLISKKLLILKVFLPLSNKLIHRFKSTISPQKRNKKRQRSKSSKKTPILVKRLSKSYFYIEHVESDISTARKKSSPSNLILRRSSPTDTIRKKRSSPDSTSRKRSSPQEKQTSRNHRSYLSTTERMVINSLKNVIHKYSPKYIHSKIRTLNFKDGKPLPLRIMQLRRGLY